MSGWVAPKFDSDFWGLPLGDILPLISNDRAPNYVDGGFEFVRLPYFAVFNEPLTLQQAPPIFNLNDSDLHLEKTDPEEVVTPEERGALIGEEPDDSEMGPPPDEDPNDNRIAQWREGRKRAGATRRGPGRSAI